MSHTTIDVPVIEATNVQPPVIQSDRSMRDAASMLRDPAVQALVVRDSPNEVTGILTESDVVAAAAEDALPLAVAHCMSTPVVTVTPETPVGLTADRMRDAGISLLPIVDAADDYHGVVTRNALAPYVSRQRLDVAWDGDPLIVDADSSDTA